MNIRTKLPSQIQINMRHTNIIFLTQLLIGWPHIPASFVNNSLNKKNNLTIPRNLIANNIQNRLLSQKGNFRSKEFTPWYVFTTKYPTDISRLILTSAQPRSFHSPSKKEQHLRILRVVGFFICPTPISLLLPITPGASEVYPDPNAVMISWGLTHFSMILDIYYFGLTWESLDTFAQIKCLKKVSVNPPWRV